MTALLQCFCKYRVDTQEFTQSEGTVSIAKQHSQRCIFFSSPSDFVFPRITALWMFPQLISNTTPIMNILCTSFPAHLFTDQSSCFGPEPVANTESLRIGLSSWEGKHGIWIPRTPGIHPHPALAMFSFTSKPVSSFELFLC